MQYAYIISPFDRRDCLTWLFFHSDETSFDSNCNNVNEQTHYVCSMERHTFWKRLFRVRTVLEQWVDNQLINLKMYYVMFFFFLTRYYYKRSSQTILLYAQWVAFQRFFVSHDITSLDSITPNGKWAPVRIVFRTRWFIVFRFYKKGTR